MEHFDRLWPKGPGFYYDDALFKPGTDSFLLGSFAAPGDEDTVCDLGAGTGLLGLLLLVRRPSLFLHCVELQGTALALAEKTFAQSGLSHRVCLHEGDLRENAVLPPAGSCDYVLSNPPYFSAGGGQPAAIASLRTARSDETCTIGDVCRAAARVLRWGGRFAVVWKPERTVDLLTAMREAGLEPKRLQWVQHSAHSAPSLLLVEGRRGGKPGLTMLSSLLLRDGKGAESAAVAAAYFREKHE